MRVLEKARVIRFGDGEHATGLASLEEFMNRRWHEAAEDMHRELISCIIPQGVDVLNSRGVVSTKLEAILHEMAVMGDF